MNGRATRTLVLFLALSAPCPARAQTETLACVAPAPTIVVPASALSGASNLVASVKSNLGSSYAWTVTNGTLYFGTFTHQISFSAGASGTVDLSVVETTAAGCVSPAAKAHVAIKPLPAWYDPLVRIVPIVVSTAGASNSFFTSEITFTNRGTTDATLDLTYTAAFGGGGGTATHALAKGKQETFADAIAFLRTAGISIPSSGNRGGTLLVRFRGVSSPEVGSVTVRTTSSLANGRAGL